MQTRSSRRTAFIAGPVRGGAIALLVVLTAVLLISIFGLVAAFQGLQQLRADREQLSNTLHLVGRFGESDAFDLADAAQEYLDDSVLQRLLPVEPEAAAIVDRVSSMIDSVRSGASRAIYADAIWQDLWALYKWYGPYIEAHATTYASFLGFFAFGLAVALSAAVASRSAIRRVEAHRRRAQQLARNQIELFELEHRSLMMELHDSLGQQLAAAQLRLSTIDDPAAAECTRLLDGSRDTIRRLARRLHPAELDQMGLSSAVRQLCDDVVRPSGVVCELELDDDVDEHVEPSQRIQVYRIVQEAVTNVVRHSEASGLRISLKRASDLIWLAVRDDGLGFEHTARKPAHGFGIMSMTERATIVGGTLAVISRPAAGTLVTLQMPARRKW